MRFTFKLYDSNYQSIHESIHESSHESRQESRQDSDHKSIHQDFERGSIEAGLTFIPTTAFFLMVLQLVLSGGFQVAEKMSLQNVVTRAALGGSQEVELFASDKRELSTETVPLPGGGELILARSEISSPRITNLLTGNPKMKAEAIAIRE